MNNAKGLSGSMRGKRQSKWILPLTGFRGHFERFYPNKLVAFKSLIKLKSVLPDCICSWYNGLF